METQPAAPASPSIRRLAPLATAIILVALCAGFVSGSCTALWAGGPGTVVIAVALAGGVALGVGLLFLVITNDRRELWFYAGNGVAAYIAAEFGAWVILDPGIGAILVAIIGGIAAGEIARKAFRASMRVAVTAGIISAIAIWVILALPGAIAILMAIVGGIAAGRVARKVFRASPGAAGAAGIISAVAVTLSAGIVVVSFFRSDYIPFAVIVGSVPSAAAATGARLAGLLCRRSQPVADSSSDDAGAGQR